MRKAAGDAQLADLPALMRKCNANDARPGGDTGLRPSTPAPLSHAAGAMGAWDENDWARTRRWKSPRERPSHAESGRWFVAAEQFRR